ncbi:MAG: MFS transporter [Clostridia bacterium]|nr:MFS transporter [Clostridia bacterium]
MSLSYKRTKIACYGGYTVQAIINNFLPILFIVFYKEYGFSYEKLGRIIFINFFVQIFADISSVFIVKKLGFKKTAILCHALATLGLCSFSFMPFIIGNNYISIIIPVIIYAFGSGIIEVVISPIMEYLPTENKAGNMAVLHSFYCWGQAFTIVITTLLVFAFGYGKWQFIPMVWAVIPFLNMINFATVPVVTPKEEDKKATEKVNYKKFIYLIIIMVCSGACEIAMSQWASFFAQEGLGVSKFVGDLLGPCCFALFMGTGRILYAVFSEKIKYLRVVGILSIACALCYLVSGLSTNPIIALLGCGFCGFTVSMFWPGTLSFAVKTFPNGGTLMFSMFALAGDIGCSSGPWILGIVANNFDLKTGIWVCSVFSIIMFAVAVLFSKENVEKSN